MASRKRVAVVGAGISGLAAAWLLSRRYDVLLLERGSRLGGHTHTHHLDTPDGPLALDTGFLVHNDRTYPLLVRLFAEIGVECLDSDMSFGVTDRRSGFEFSTRNLNGLFADRRNLIRPGHYRLLSEILRFNREARAFVDHGDADVTLGEFLDRHRFGGELIDRFLLPLGAAIWSAAPQTLRAFPALTLIRFFHQHGMITLLDHPRWRVVKNGSDSYIPKLLASPRITTWTEAAPRSVRRHPDGVELTFRNRPPTAVDEVVFACHGDDVLPMLADPTPTERDVLGAFRTTENEAVLHTDVSWLPRRESARASWNYLLGHAPGAATVTYHLNRLQRLAARRDYCVTLNPPEPIEPYHLLRQMTYRHPLYTLESVGAQGLWADVSGPNHTHYCGAYWYYGFHEDGLRSAVRVAGALGVTW